MPFWNCLYDLCLQKNCKPNTVAKAIGLSTATATKWKNGAIPNGEALTKIADYLDCSVDYLLGRTEIVNPTSTKQIDKISEEGKAIGKAFDQATPKDKETVRIVLSDYMSNDS